jgi:hypothetical protein
MEFFGSIILGGRTTRFTVHEGNDISPRWGSHRIIGDAGTVDAIITIRDDDDIVCGGGDDQVDVNPERSQQAVRVRLDISSKQVVLLDKQMNPMRVVGGVGEPITMTGSHGDELGEITFRFGMTR